MDRTSETNRMTVTNRSPRAWVSARLFRLTGFGLLGVLALGLMTLGVSAFLFGAGDSVRAQEAKFFRIATGSTGGSYFPIGTSIANVISSPPGARPCDRGGSCGVPGLIALAKTTGGSVENVRQIAKGEVESGLSQADIAYAALNGAGIFKGEKGGEKLRAIASLYHEAVHLVVRADSKIETVKDLRGKRVSLGEKGSGTLVDSLILLKAHGLTEKNVKPVYLQPGASVDRLVEGEIDALFFIAGTPAGAIAELAGRVPVRLVPLAGTAVEKVLKNYPFFRTGMIPEGAYGELPATETLTVAALWLVSAEVDADLVYQITRALWHENSRAELDKRHAVGKLIRLETALEGVPVPLHPGAERFYREAGLLPANAEAATPTQ